MDIFAVIIAPLALGLGSLNVTIGALTYPFPAFVNVRLIMTPMETLATAAAPVPPPPVMTTYGVE